MPKTNKYLDLMRSAPVVTTKAVSLEDEEIRLKNEAAQIILDAISGSFLHYSDGVAWAWQIAKKDRGEATDSRALVRWAKQIKEQS